MMWRYQWVWAAVVLVAAFVLIGYSLGRINDRASEGEQAIEFLCAYREEVRERIVTASKFLLQHPDGVKGISGETMEQYLTDQERTLEILDQYLNCEGRDEPSSAAEVVAPGS
jgi:hypothetical protein